jgi:hypothetical protein
MRSEVRTVAVCSCDHEILKVELILHFISSVLSIYLLSVSWSYDRRELINRDGDEVMVSPGNAEVFLIS